MRSRVGHLLRFTQRIIPLTWNWANQAAVQFSRERECIVFSSSTPWNFDEKPFGTIGAVFWLLADQKKKNFPKRYFQVDLRQAFVLTGKLQPPKYGP